MAISGKLFKKHRRPIGSPSRVLFWLDAVIGDVSREKRLRAVLEEPPRALELDVSRVRDRF